MSTPEVVHPPRPPFDQSALAARLRLTEAIRLRLIALGFVAIGEQVSENEEYTRANWERAEICETVTGPYLKWCVSLGGRGFTRACIPDDWAMSEAEAWTAAAEFTRERKEQIRQLEEEIAVQHAEVGNYKSLMDAERQSDSRPEESWFSSMGDRLAAIKRTIARLESALADLRRGMK